MSDGIKTGGIAVLAYLAGSFVKESDWYKKQVTDNTASGNSGAPLMATGAVWGAALATGWLGHRFLLHKKS